LPALVTTLSARLEAADALFAQGRPGALAAYEEVIARAQDKSDRAMEVSARSMAARCLLSRHDAEAAAAHLLAAEVVVDPWHLPSYLRFRAARARVDSARGVAEAYRAYLSWAEEHDQPEAVVDAARLCAAATTGEPRVVLLERAVEVAVESGREPELGVLFTELAAALDEAGRAEEAFYAYESALRHVRATAKGARNLAGAAWAAGASALRIDDFPLARTRLEEAIRLSEGQDEASDLLALALGDLARVAEAAGDVVEARHLVLRAIKLGREQDLRARAPERWDALVFTARALDLDV
jgi:tetratricopeptide (TPR) repeat protein